MTMKMLTLNVRWEPSQPLRLLRVELVYGTQVLFQTTPSLKGRVFRVLGRRYLWRNRYA